MATRMAWSTSRIWMDGFAVPRGQQLVRHRFQRHHELGRLCDGQRLPGHRVPVLIARQLLQSTIRKQNRRSLNPRSLQSDLELRRPRPTMAVLQACVSGGGTLSSARAQLERRLAPPCERPAGRRIRQIPWSAPIRAVQESPVAPGFQIRRSHGRFFRRLPSARIRCL